MTREEQIRKANPYPENGSLWKHIGFNEGAKWADSHPNWHKWPEDKPKKGGWYNCVVSENNEKYTIPLWYEYNTWLRSELFGEEEYEYELKYNVRAWAELPKFDSV